MEKLISLLFILSVSFAQQTWIRTYGGSDQDYGWSVQQTADGGYIIAGITSSFGVGDFDIYLIKTNVSGDTLWTRTYGGTDREEGSSVQQTADGGYIIAGYTYSFGAGSSDVYLIKTDASGDTLWTRTYGGTDREEGSSVQQTADSGYIITGNTYPLYNWHVYLIKTDANGNPAVEEEKNRVQNLDTRLKAMPNPFTSFTRIPGYEKDNFALSDITGRMIGIYKGEKIGANLSTGIYFVMSKNKNISPLRIMKIK